MKTGTESVTGSRILIVSTHSLFGQGVAQLLHGDISLSILGIESDVHKALHQVRELRPDSIIVDTSDPHCDPTPILAQVLHDGQDVMLIGLNLSDNVACVCSIAHTTVSDVSDLLAVLHPAAYRMHRNLGVDPMGRGS